MHGLALNAQMSFFTQLHLATTKVTGGNISGQSHHHSFKKKKWLRADWDPQYAVAILKTEGFCYFDVDGDTRPLSLQWRCWPASTVYVFCVYCRVRPVDKDYHGTNGPLPVSSDFELSGSHKAFLNAGKRHQSGSLFSPVNLYFSDGLRN